MESSQSNHHFVAVIRHGERMDMVENMPFKNKCDPPLSPLGVEQAAVTGRFLKKYFSDNGFHFDKIIVETSPFIRCMMTSG